MKKNSLLIELNQVCNLECEYCFYNQSKRDKNFLELQKIKKLNLKNVKEIFLTGGEPFLHKNILEILKYLKSKNIKIVVFSNGIILNSFSKTKFEEILKYLDKIIISFDSFRNDYTIRGNKNKIVFECIKKILNYKKEILEIKIGINTYNYDEFELILDKFIRMGVKNFSINLIHNVTSSTKNFELSEKKIDKILKIIENKKEFFNQKYLDAHKKFINKEISNLINTCKAGNEFLFVNNQGELFGCPAFLEKLPLNKKECFSKYCINLWEMF